MTLYLLELVSLPEENSILIEILHQGNFQLIKQETVFHVLESIWLLNKQLTPRQRAG